MHPIFWIKGEKKRKFDTLETIKKIYVYSKSCKLYDVRFMLYIQQTKKKKKAIGLFLLAEMSQYFLSAVEWELFAQKKRQGKRDRGKVDRKYGYRLIG